MTKPYEGGCLCGAVRFKVEGEPVLVGDCYCTQCRKASGTSHCTHAMFREDGLDLRGALTFYEHEADSGATISKGFCGSCGSPILSYNLHMQGIAAMRVSVFDDPDVLEPQMTVYAASAPKWARIDRTKPVFERMPEGGPQSVME